MIQPFAEALKEIHQLIIFLLVFPKEIRELIIFFFNSNPLRTRNRLLGALTFFSCACPDWVPSVVVRNATGNIFCAIAKVLSEDKKIEYCWEQENLILVWSGSKVLR